MFQWKNIAGFSKAGQFIIALGGNGGVVLSMPMPTRSPKLFWLAVRFHQPLLTNIYKQYVQEQLKTWVWPQSPLERLSEVKAAENLKLHWVSHTKAAVSILKDGKTATLKQDGKPMAARFRRPFSALFEAMPAVPLPSLPQPELNDKNVGIKKFMIHIEGTKEAVIALVFTLQGLKKSGWFR